MLSGGKGVKAVDADTPAEAWLWKYGHILLVAVVTFNARNAVYEVLHAALGSRPSDGTLLGALLLVIAGGCIPLQAKQQTGWRSARKVTALIGILGVLLIALQPPLPLQVYTFRKAIRRSHLRILPQNDGVICLFLSHCKASAAHAGKDTKISHGRKISEWKIHRFLPKAVIACSTSRF